MVSPEPRLECFGKPRELYYAAKCLSKSPHEYLYLRPISACCLPATEQAYAALRTCRLKILLGENNSRSPDSIQDLTALLLLSNIMQSQPSPIYHPGAGSPCGPLLHKSLRIPVSVASPQGACRTLVSMTTSAT